MTDVDRHGSTGEDGRPRRQEERLGAGEKEDFIPETGKEGGSINICRMNEPIINVNGMRDTDQATLKKP